MDFTNLNKTSLKDSFPLPHIDHPVDVTFGHAILTFMDAYSGYNQIPMNVLDEEQTSFITNWGLNYYKVTPFQLKNAGATYQRLVKIMFADQISKTIEVYINDMLVKSKNTSNKIPDLVPMFNLLRWYKINLTHWNVHLE